MSHSKTRGDLEEQLTPPLLGKMGRCNNNIDVPENKHKGNAFARKPLPGKHKNANKLQIYSAVVTL
jgi:hypothetical protein